MPRKSARGCAIPGCPNLTREGIYCREHRRERRKEYDQQLGTAAHRDYGSRWRRLRNMFLQANPLCADPCKGHERLWEVAAVTEVDHINPKDQGGTDDWNNLQSLCKSCHSRKTAIEDGRWG